MRLLRWRILLHFVRCFFLCFLTGFVATLALGWAGQQSKRTDVPNRPDALVRSLYQKVLALHPLGDSVGGHLKVFAPYLSKALVHGIDLANACDMDWYRQNPDTNSKPPGLEGGLFTGDDADPRSFHIERTESEKDGSFRVYVKFTDWDESSTEQPWTWRVAAVVVREKGRFVVDDVIYLKDEDVKDGVESRLSEYWSAECDGGRWVGYREQRE